MLPSWFSNSSIFVAGHNGMVGSAIVKNLEKTGHKNLLLQDRTELDLCNQSKVAEFFASEAPEIVVIAAAKVGGIEANRRYPAEFAYDNLAIGLNLVHAAHRYGTKRLLFLGSSCIYPKDAEQPMTEDALLSGPMEPTNEAYAIAKIAILKLCQYYRRQYGNLFYSAMPCNLYGPGDNYHPEDSHVIASLIRRFHQAKLQGEDSVEVWGTGNPRREFLFVEDFAEACIQLLTSPDPPDVVNVGSGSDLTIRELAITIADVIGFEGTIHFDSEKPDGVFRKLIASPWIRSEGWQPETNLESGLRRTYLEFLKSE